MEEGVGKKVPIMKREKILSALATYRPQMVLNFLARSSNGLLDILELG